MPSGQDMEDTGVPISVLELPRGIDDNGTKQPYKYHVQG